MRRPRSCHTSHVVKRNLPDKAQVGAKRLQLEPWYHEQRDLVCGAFAQDVVRLPDHVELALGEIVV